MAKLSLLRKAPANPRLVPCPAEHECSIRDAGASDLLLSPGEGVSGLLPAMRAVRVCAVRFATWSGARLPDVFRARARRYWA